MKIEVPLYKESEKYIKETFSRYTESKKLPFSLTLDNCIIHMYPHSDTYDDNGELNGYVDALFFRAHIYDVKNGVVYKSEIHDAIFTEANCQIKYFKDMSTMVHFERPINIIMGRAIHVMSV